MRNDENDDNVGLSPYYSKLDDYDDFGMEKEFEQQLKRIETGAGLQYVRESLISRDNAKVYFSSDFSNLRESGSEWDCGGVHSRPFLSIKFAISNCCLKATKVEITRHNIAVPDSGL